MLMCRELATIASDYLDGRLGPGKRISVKVHLMMCRHCRAFVSNLRHTVVLMKAHSSQTPAPDYLLRLDDEIARVLADQEQSPPDR